MPHANSPRYRYCTEWSAEDNEWVGTCPEIPGLSGLGGTPSEAMEELEIAIQGWLEYLAAERLPIPQPGSNALSGMLVDGNVCVVWEVTPVSGTTASGGAPLERDKTYSMAA